MSDLTLSCLSYPFLDVASAAAAEGQKRAEALLSPRKASLAMQVVQTQILLIPETPGALLVDLRRRSCSLHSFPSWTRPTVGMVAEAEMWSKKRRRVFEHEPCAVCET